MGSETGLIVTVGSQNATKIEAVREALGRSKYFADAQVVPVEVVTEEFGHPVGLEQVVHGAQDRAQQAFRDCRFSIGIEGGLVAAPGTKSGYLEIAVCAIYDGEQFHLGTSPGFEWPPAVIDSIINKGLDGSQAFRAAGFTKEEKIGKTGGAISVLTHGVIDRKAYNTIAVTMALLPLENLKHY